MMINIEILIYVYVTNSLLQGLKSQTEVFATVMWIDRRT